VHPGARAEWLPAQGVIVGAARGVPQSLQNLAPAGLS